MKFNTALLSLGLAATACSAAVGVQDDILPKPSGILSDISSGIAGASSKIESITSKLPGGSKSSSGTETVSSTSSGSSSASKTSSASTTTITSSTKVPVTTTDSSGKSTTLTSTSAVTTTSTKSGNPAPMVTANILAPVIGLAAAMML